MCRLHCILTYLDDGRSAFLCLSTTVGEFHLAAARVHTPVEGRKEGGKAINHLWEYTFGSIYSIMKNHSSSVEKKTLSREKRGC